MQEGEPRKWLFQGCSARQETAAIPRQPRPSHREEATPQAGRKPSARWQGRPRDGQDGQGSLVMPNAQDTTSSTGYARRKGNKGDPSPVSSFCNELYLLLTNERKNEQRAFSLHHSCSLFHWWWEEAKVKQRLSRGPIRAGKNFPRHKARQIQAPQQFSNYFIFLCTHMHLACWEYQSKLIPPDLVMI